MTSSSARAFMRNSLLTGIWRYHQIIAPLVIKSWMRKIRSRQSCACNQQTHIECVVRLLPQGFQSWTLIFTTEFSLMKAEWAWIIASTKKNYKKEKWLNKKPIKLSWQKNFKLSMFVSLSILFFQHQNLFQILDRVMCCWKLTRKSSDTWKHKIVHTCRCWNKWQGNAQIIYFIVIFVFLFFSKKGWMLLSCLLLVK